MPDLPFREPSRDYYDRTQTLPAPERYQDFLNQLPQNGRILDFGCGNGRFSAAFHRDRPDITIDMLDQNISDSLRFPIEWQGEKLSQDMKAFKAAECYDGIWANASLFFVDKHDLPEVFHNLAQALKPSGVLTFTFTREGEEVHGLPFTGLEENALRTMLDKAGLNVTSLETKNLRYGKSQVAIPTFLVAARRA